MLAALGVHTGVFERRVGTGTPPDTAQYRRLTVSGLYRAAILEQARDAICVTDRDGTVAIWNGAAGELFGVRPPHVLGRRVDAVIASDAGRSLLEQIRSLSPSAAAVSHELVLSAGGPRHIGLSLSLAFDERREGFRYLSWGET